VTSLRSYTIYCNGRIPYGHEGRMMSCSKRYEPPADADWKQTSTPSGLRRLAAKDGWTHVRDNYGSRFDKDYCPAHKPQEAAANAPQA
jgi:hypothetical protein